MRHKCLKINLLIAILLGFIRCKVPKKNSWYQFVANYYYNILFVTILSSYILHLLTFSTVEKNRYTISSFNENISAILMIICDGLEEIWIFSYILILLYLRFNFCLVLILVKKLRSFKKLENKSKNKEYSTFILGFGLKLYLAFNFIMCKKEVTAFKELFLLDFTLICFSSFSLMNTVDTFFSFIRYILIIMDPLEKKLSILKKRGVNGSTRESHSTGHDIFWENIREEICSLKDFMEDFCNIFQIVVSFIFLCNFIYTFSFVTKIATEANNITTGELVNNFMGLVYVLIILLISDLP